MTIIVATDFSAIAENAVLYAANIAKKNNAQLIMYYGYSIPLHASNSRLPAASYQAMIDNARNKLDFKAKVIAEKYGIKIIPEWSFPFSAEHLKHLISHYEADLLVIGMPEKSLEQDLMGNTTTSVIKNIRIPILAVPEKATFKPVNKILYACDDPGNIELDVFKNVTDVVEYFGGAMVIFSVENEIGALKTENSTELANNATETNLQGINYYYKNVRSNAIIGAIKDEINEIGADILIMVPKQYGFWTSLVHRSKTRLLASGLHIPLLSLPQ